MTVTRAEIADHLEGAFASGPQKGGGLVTAAELQGARPEVVQVLARLPEGTYSTLRDLWEHLPDVPRGT